MLSQETTILLAAIASGISQLSAHYQDEIYPFLKRKTPVLSQGLEEVNIDPRVISEAVPLPHMQTNTYTHSDITATKERGVLALARMTNCSVCQGGRLAGKAAGR